METEPVSLSRTCVTRTGTAMICLMNRTAVSSSYFSLLPPAYVVRREGNSFTLLVCPQGGVPVSHNALQHFPECHGAAGGGGTLPGPAGGGTLAGGGGTLAGGVPWPGGYPGWGGTLAGGGTLTGGGVPS